MFNKKCPYTLRPVSEIESNREHIIPDALGGPNGFALNADAKTNSAFGDGVDASLINQPLMQMKASQAKVQTRSGPVVVKLQGQLALDSSPTDIRIAENGQTTFRTRVPVIKDPVTGQVTGIRGYGDAAQMQLEDLIAAMAKKGRTVIADEPVAHDSTTKVHLAHDIAKDDQGMAKIAYLMAVWVMGDPFIDTPAAEAFRKLIFGAPTSEAIASSGVCVLRANADEQFMPPSAHEHQLICIAANGMLFISIALFCEPFFTRRFITPLVWTSTSRAIVVNATNKTFEERSNFLPF